MGVRKRSPSELLLRKLEDLHRAGVTHIPRPRRPPVPTEPGRDGPVVPLSGGVTPGLGEPATRAAALEALARKVAACTRCAALAAQRTQTVFGSGNPSARLVFIGEAPGADEDRHGVPFVGRAGQLLTDIITKGMGLRREDVYILNTIKCRPPDNRTPEPVEIAHCREYLDHQLAIIQPEFVCCLGSVAAQALLGTKASLGQLRGRFHDVNGIQVICTYHPAYLLRYPQYKRQVWDDVQMLMKQMGLPPRGRA